MDGTWPLQKAKDKFSEVVDRAAKHGPQTVTRHGKRVAVIVSATDYDRIKSPAGSLWDYLRSAPTQGVRLKLDRHPDPGRIVKL